MKKAIKRSFIFFLITFCSSYIRAQVKIGDNPQTLDATSLLELESNSKVLVISRMSEAEILALSPLQGAVVYNTDASCIFYYDGVNWINLCANGGTDSISWGSIRGSLTEQTDLVAEFENYVNLTAAQSIAGEKTLTEKLTVDTGAPTDQIAEFRGRVTGEDGTEPEDFVTKAQLDASGGGGGSATWGSIGGTLTDQTDLAAQFENYVNLTAAQSIAGEKTLTEKLTVDTGSPTDQIAEFRGRVTGEDGTAAEDFVTRRQLNAVALTGATGQEGSIFFAGSDTGLTENNTELFWDNSLKQLRIGSKNLPNQNGSNNSTLSIKGSVSKAIIFGETVLNETHHTVIINDPNVSNAQIVLPPASEAIGRIYIIKRRPSITITIQAQYIDREYNSTNEMSDTILHLQSNGFQWEQIN